MSVYLISWRFSLLVKIILASYCSCFVHYSIRNKISPPRASRWPGRWTARSHALRVKGREWYVPTNGPQFSGASLPRALDETSSTYSTSQPHLEPINSPPSSSPFHYHSRAPWRLQLVFPSETLQPPQKKTSLSSEDLETLHRVPMDYNTISFLVGSRALARLSLTGLQAQRY